MQADNSADMSYSVQASAVLLQGKLLSYGAGKHRPVILLCNCCILVQVLHMKPVSPPHVTGMCVRARWRLGVRAIAHCGQWGLRQRQPVVP